MAPKQSPQETPEEAQTILFQTTSSSYQNSIIKSLWHKSCKSHTGKWWRVSSAGGEHFWKVIKISTCLLFETSVGREDCHSLPFSLSLLHKPHIVHLFAVFYYYLISACYTHGNWGKFIQMEFSAREVWRRRRRRLQMICDRRWRRSFVLDLALVYFQ